MKQKLTVLDRANLLTVLTPKFNDINTMEIVEKIQTKVEFEQLEITAAKIEFAHGNLSWNEKEAVKVKDIEVDFTKEELEVINDQINLLNQNKQVNKTHLPTIRKFWTRTEPK